MDIYDEETETPFAIATRRANALQNELSEAKARIAELEKANAEKPLTIRQMKADIEKAIGESLSGSYPYCTTVNRADLLKIHAWIMERKSSV